MKTRNNGHYEAGFYKRKFKQVESSETKLKPLKKDMPLNFITRILKN